MILRLRLLFGILLSAVVLSYGQHAGSTGPQPPKILPDRVPTSPGAASLERYALMPVNESAGTPSIGIPLYEVRSGQLTMPLSLSYHASGIRVSDIASWAGLGWSLNAGGVITRVVRGMPDDEPGGYRENCQKVPNSPNMNPLDGYGVPTAAYYTMDWIAQAKLDFEPDLYTYNFSGHAGAFMQGNDGLFHPLPLQPIQITVGADSSITIVDEHGNSNLFKDKEFSSTAPRARLKHISAWYLTRMISADRADTIQFEYQSSSTAIMSVQQQANIVSDVAFFSNVGDGGLSKNPQDTYSEIISIANVNTKRLRRIRFKGGVVEFVAGKGRVDGGGDSILDAVRILAANKQDTLKQVRLRWSS